MNSLFNALCFRRQDRKVKDSYIGRAIKEHHRGRHWAHSDGPTRGACFSFEIPKVPA